MAERSLKKITAERIEGVASKLRALPPTKRQLEYSLEDALARLEPEIVALRERGYTLARIAKTLRDEGLTLDVATLKAFLSKAAGALAAPLPKRNVSSASTTRKVTTKAQVPPAAPSKRVAPTVVEAPRSASKSTTKNGATKSASKKTTKTTKAPTKRASTRAAADAEIDDAAQKRSASRAMFEIRPDTDDI